MNSAPTFVYCDETGTLGKFTYLIEWMATKRGFGIQFWLFYQNLSQARFYFGDGYDVITGLCAVIQYFGGTGDKLTSDRLAEFSGKDTRIVGGQTVQFGGKPGGSNSSSLMGRDNYMPDEVQRLPLPEMLVQYMGLGMAEGHLIHPSLSDFPEYLAFMRVIEAEGPAEQAVAAAEVVIAGRSNVQPTPPPAPLKTRKSTQRTSPNGLADTFLRRLMGHADE